MQHLNSFAVSSFKSHISCKIEARYNTRQASKGDTIMTKENTLQYGLRSTSYSGAKSWNETPYINKRYSTIMIMIYVILDDTVGSPNRCCSLLD